MDAFSNSVAGPSGLNVHTSVSVTVNLAGNGLSMNGTSGSDTPRRPKKDLTGQILGKETLPKLRERREKCIFLHRLAGLFQVDVLGCLQLSEKVF